MSVEAYILLLANTAKIAYLPQPSVKDADKPAMLLRGWLFVILLRRAGCPSSAVPVMSPKYTRHTLKMPFGKIRPISCYFLSYSKVGEKCSFVTPKGKNCPGFSCMEVRVFINRFGDGTMENS